MSIEPAEICMSIGSRFENIELVQAVVEENLERLPFDEDERYWIGIALREALANAIKHGNRQIVEKKVEVQLSIEPDSATIVVKDEGEGFDPDAVSDPLEPKNLLKTDGRGIFYMNRFMDQIEYSFRPGGGTVVTLKKSFGGAGESGTSHGED